jgi:hypothetical protein
MNLDQQLEHYQLLELFELVAVVVVVERKLVLVLQH